MMYKYFIDWVIVNLCSTWSEAHQRKLTAFDCEAAIKTSHTCVLVPSSVILVTVNSRLLLIMSWTHISRPSFSLSPRIPHTAKKWTTCILSVCVCEMVKVKETRNAVSFNTIPLSSKGWFISFMWYKSDFENGCPLSFITSKVPLIRINWDS
jgi:hypothetical protein